MMPRKLQSLIDPEQLPLFTLRFVAPAGAVVIHYTPHDLLGFPVLNAVSRDDQIACMASSVYIIQQRIGENVRPGRYAVSLSIAGKKLSLKKISTMRTQYITRLYKRAWPAHVLGVLREDARLKAVFWESLRGEMKDGILRRSQNTLGA